MVTAEIPLGRSAVRRLLRQCIIEHDWNRPIAELDDLLRGRDATPLVAVAEYQRVLPAVFLSLHGLTNLPPDVEAALSDRYVAGAVGGMHAAQALGFVGDVLERAQIDWLSFKGPVIGAMYSRTDLRTYADIDVLVPPEAFADAVSAMEGAGCQLLDANWRLISDQMRGQVHLVLPDGTLCDLHWSLLNRHDQRRAFPISTCALFKDRTSTPVAGLDVPTLAPTATVVHLCLHASLSGGDRLGWLVDIDRALRTLRPEWEDVADVARAWRARLATAVMLDRARRIAATPVPRGVLDALAPSSILAAVAVGDAAASFGSTVHPFTSIALTTPLYRNVGLGLSPRLRRLLHARHAAALGSSVLRRSWSPRAARIPSEPVTAPGGGTRERGEYFSKVAAQR